MSTSVLQTSSLPSGHAYYVEPMFPIYQLSKVARASLSNTMKGFMRILAFLMMEIAFIALAMYSHSKHIPLSIPYPDTSPAEAKGVVTFISIVWHAIAVFLVKDIAINVFSAEWMEHARNTGKLVAGETDSVSRISAGFLDRIQHITSPTATLSFRLGFIMTLLLLGLNGIGPSAITVDLIPLPHPTKIQVANLTLSKAMLSTSDFSLDRILDGSDEPIGIAAVDRANLVTRFELLEQSVYGFQGKEKNVLMPWPSLALLEAKTKGTIQYESDIIAYDFHCTWERPAPFVPDTISGVVDRNVYWNVSGHTYILYSWGDFRSSVQLEVGPAIVPLVTLDPGISQVENPLTAFLFVGTNGTKPRDPVPSMSLEGLPTVAVPELSPNALEIESGTSDSPLPWVTVLICDPQLQVKPATILLSDGSLSLVDLREGAPTVGNIPVGAANAIFAYSLVGATSFSQQRIYTQLNDISSNLFFEHLTGLHTIGQPSPSAQPLPIGDINRNMNRVLLSSSKAFLSGYNGTMRDSVTPDSSLVETDAVGQSDHLALGGSKPFTIVLVVLVGSVVVLSAAIVIIGQHEHLHPFDLEHIFGILTLRLEK